MTLTIQKLTLAEYLAYHDGTDNRYELVAGELKRMATGTGQHGQVIEFLNDELRAEIARSQHPWTAKQRAVGIQSPRGHRWDTCRIPESQWLQSPKWREPMIFLWECLVC